MTAGFRFREVKGSGSLVALYRLRLLTASLAEGDNPFYSEDFIAGRVCRCSQSGRGVMSRP